MPQILNKILDIHVAYAAITIINQSGIPSIIQADWLSDYQDILIGIRNVKKRVTIKEHKGKMPLKDLIHEYSTKAPEKISTLNLYYMIVWE